MGWKGSWRAANSSPGTGWQSTQDNPKAFWEPCVPLAGALAALGAAPSLVECAGAEEWDVGVSCHRVCPGMGRDAQRDRTAAHSTDNWAGNSPVAFQLRGFVMGTLICCWD